MAVGLADGSQPQFDEARFDGSAVLGVGIRPQSTTPCLHMRVS